MFIDHVLLLDWHYGIFLIDSGMLNITKQASLGASNKWIFLKVTSVISSITAFDSQVLKQHVLSLREYTLWDAAILLLRRTLLVLFCLCEKTMVCCVTKRHNQAVMHVCSSLQSNITEVICGSSHGRSIHPNNSKLWRIIWAPRRKQFNKDHQNRWALTVQAMLP